MFFFFSFLTKPSDAKMLETYLRDIRMAITDHFVVVFLFMSSVGRMIFLFFGQFGVQPKQPSGLVLEPVANLAMEWFSNPAAEVRESSVRLRHGCSLSCKKHI